MYIEIMRFYSIIPKITKKYIHVHNDSMRLYSKAGQQIALSLIMSCLYMYINARTLLMVNISSQTETEIL